MTRSFASVSLVGLAMAAFGQFQTVYNALDQYALNKAIPTTDGGAWLLQNGSNGNVSPQLIRLDDQGAAIRAFEVTSDVLYTSWPNMVATANGGALAVFPQQSMHGPGADMPSIDLPVIAFDAQGLMLWQKNFSRPTTSVVNVNGNPLATANDALGNTFIVISCGYTTEVVCLNGDQLVWWSSCGAGIAGMNACIPDGLGGCYLMVGGISHINSSGQIDWTRSIGTTNLPSAQWMTASMSPGGSLRVMAVAMPDQLLSVELSSSGAVLAASTYAPLDAPGGTMPEIRAAGQTNGKTVVVSTSGNFITLNSAGDVESAYRSPIGWSNLQHSGESVLLSGVKSYSDPDLNEPQYAAVVWDAQQDMSQYCTLEEVTVTRTAWPVSDLVVTEDIPFVGSAQIEALQVSFTLNELPLPAPQDYCVMLAPLLSTSVPDIAQPSQLRVLPSVVQAGDVLRVTYEKTGQLRFVASTGALVRETRLSAGATEVVPTTGLAPGLYSLQVVDRSGRVMERAGLVVE